ncbi:MAG: CRISP-associated protein Cas1 [Acidobacteriota bacterium]|nr:CRISP-associated protein Cas1 [Acidobacteriota bacterium]
MKKNYYIFNSGRLRRLDNSLQFIKIKKEEEETPKESGPLVDVEMEEIGAPPDNDNPVSDPETPALQGQDMETITKEFQRPKEEKIYLPVEDIDSIYAFGELDFNSKVMNFLAQKGIIVHYFNYYGFYTGSFYPREALVSGMLLVNQVKHYMAPKKRLLIAIRIIEAAAWNILHNLKYYDARGKDLREFIQKIEELSGQLSKQASISALMGVEGNIREVYYRAFNTIIDQDIQFEKRVKHPPDNLINTMISFSNSIVYTTVLSEIYKTQLDPLVSFLHEPGERRFSLSLDIAEIFKPMLADRMIFSLLNKNQITEKSFEKELNYLYLKDEARKIIAKDFDERLKTTVRHKTLTRNVSYRQLIRLELYKLIKHLIGEKEYEGFKIWW